jgi:glycosyltransferase involved in cell wall biosynthesis
VLDHRNSRVYRALVRVGRWRAYEERVQQALGEHRSRAAPPPLAGARQEVEWTIEPGPAVRGGGAIAVDLTALLPGGENGGAKRVATSLVRLFARLAPERDFVLLTSAPCHVELAALEAPNVRRRPLGTDPSALAELLAGEPFALLFCPLTAPPWSDPRVPLVCLVHDLQYLAYPDFFDDAERGGRDDAFRRAVRWSEKIVTDSEYVRRTILEHAGLGEDRVVAIPIGFAGGCPEIGEEEADAVLARHGLEREGYFLYPANFWPHKNHRMLLVAFGQLHRRHPDLKLVLTGAERPDPEPLVEASRRMGLGDAVRVAGWVSDGELAALLRGCRALVFPSLYEGFGMPVVEAMACGRPVACSRATSLPEVAGDAALYFDPRLPGEIAGALERLARGGDDVEELRRRGPRRARELGDADSTARAYLDLFDAVAAAPRRWRDRLAGVFSDGWTPARAVVSRAAGRRELELGLANPRGESVSVELCGHRATLAPRTSLVVRCRLPAAGGCLELDVSPTFCPQERGFSTDPRHLGLELWSCRLAGGGDDLDLLARSADG